MPATGPDFISLVDEDPGTASSHSTSVQRRRLRWCSQPAVDQL